MFKLNVMEIKSHYLTVYLIDSLDEWHAKLGHLNFNSIKNMIKLELISTNSIEKQEKYNISVQVKFTKKPFSSVARKNQLLDLIHTDVCDLNRIFTRGGKRYFVIFIDDFLDIFQINTKYFTMIMANNYCMMFLNVVFTHTWTMIWHR